MTRQELIDVTYNIRVSQYRSRIKIEDYTIRTIFALPAAAKNITKVKIIAVHNEEELNTITSEENTVYIVIIPKEYREAADREQGTTEVISTNPTQHISKFAREEMQIYLIDRKEETALWNIAADLADNEYSERWRNKDIEGAFSENAQKEKEEREAEAEKFVENIEEKLQELFENTNEIEEYRRKAEEVYDQIKRLLTSIENAQQTIEMYNEKIARCVYNAEHNEQALELKKTIKKMYKRGVIKEIDINNSDLSLVLKTKLAYISSEDYNAMMHSQRPNVLKNAKDYIKFIIKEIAEEKCAINIAQKVRIRTTNGHINCARGRIDETSIPNPHHNYYNCWGDYQTEIARATVEQDYEGVIGLVINAMAGVNILDSAVLTRFITDIETNKENRILWDRRTKTDITPIEYARRYMNE